MEPPELKAPQTTVGAENPAVMSTFTLRLTEGSVTKESITGRTAHFFQEDNVIYIQKIHVDIFTSGSKDTLDAPEGYLYLNNLEGEDAISSENLAYVFKEIGGKQANIDLMTSDVIDLMASDAAIAAALPDTVTRYRRDMDLIGTPLRKVLYRRANGTIADCLRAYRQNRPDRPPMLFGAHDVRVIQPQKSEGEFTGKYTLMTGDYFSTDATDVGKKEIKWKGFPNIRPIKKEEVERLQKTDR